MPFRYEEAKTPKGAPLLLIYAAGEVSLEDAQSLGALIGPDGPNHRWRVLSIVEKGTEYSHAARKYFPSLNQQHYGALAAVVTSPVVRAAINMMMRLSGQAPDLRLFSSEDEALAWLDSFTF